MPVFGSHSFPAVVNNLSIGWNCFLEKDEKCKENGCFFLMFSYCIINFLFNILGLFLIKHGSAVFNSISYAIILPLTVLSFNLPLLGKFQEAFSPSTLYGLLIVLIGFFIWRKELIISKQELLLDQEDAQGLGEKVDEALVTEHVTESFQERTILLGSPAITTRLRRRSLSSGNGFGIVLGGEAAVSHKPRVGSR